MKFRTYALPATFSAVRPFTAGDPPIIMQSVAYGNAPLAVVSAEGSLRDAIAAAQGMHAKLVAENPDRTFTITTSPIGRKCPGFDAARLALSPSYYGLHAPTVREG
jgi:hypothetical protein